MKKTILLIGIAVILLMNIVNARGAGYACPSIDISYIQNANYIIYSKQTDTLVFRLSLKDYGIIRNYSNSKNFNRKTIGYVRKINNYYVTEWDYEYVNITSPFINSTIQEEINIVFLKFLNNNCEQPYNFGKVTYHKKAIMETHYY